MPLSITLATLTKDLFQIGAIKIDTKEGGGFKLKYHETHPDAPLSPIYLNLRTQKNPKPGPLTPMEIQLITTQWRKRIRGLELNFEGIVGLPNAGTPLAEALALDFNRVNRRYGVPKLGKTTNADGRKIGGLIDRDGVPPGATLLVVDDLIAQGESKKEAIDELLKGGYRVTDVLVVVDREQGGREYLARHGIKLHSLCTLREMLEFLQKADRITRREYAKVIAYLNDTRTHV